MSFNDNWLKNGLPTYQGGKDGTAARKMIDKLGGPSGFKSAYQTNADGSVTTVQLKGDMPPQVTTTSTKLIENVYAYLYYSYPDLADYVPPATPQDKYRLVGTVLQDGLPVTSSKFKKIVASDRVLPTWQSATKDLASAVPATLARIHLDANRLFSVDVRNYAMAWRPDGTDDYTYLPVIVSDKVAYLGNYLHGSVQYFTTEDFENFATITNAATDEAVTMEVASAVGSPNTFLVNLNSEPDPVLSRALLPPGPCKVMNRAILHGQHRTYDLLTGISMGTGKHLYLSTETKTPFMISVEVSGYEYPVAKGSSGVVKVKITAARCSPHEGYGLEAVILPTTSLSFVAVNPKELAYQYAPHLTFSPDGTKCAVVMYEYESTGDAGFPIALYNSQDNRAALRVAACWEFTLLGGSLLSWPTCSVDQIVGDSDYTETTTIDQSTLCKYTEGEQTRVEVTVGGWYNGEKLPKGQVWVKSDTYFGPTTPIYNTGSTVTTERVVFVAYDNASTIRPLKTRYVLKISYESIVNESDFPESYGAEYIANIETGEPVLIIKPLTPGTISNNYVFNVVWDFEFIISLGGKVIYDYRPRLVATSTRRSKLEAQWDYAGASSGFSYHQIGDTPTEVNTGDDLVRLEFFHMLTSNNTAVITNHVVGVGGVSRVITPEGVHHTMPGPPGDPLWISWNPITDELNWKQLSTWI